MYDEYGQHVYKQCRRESVNKMSFVVSVARWAVLPYSLSGIVIKWKFTEKEQDHEGRTQNEKCVRRSLCPHFSIIIRSKVVLWGHWTKFLESKH